MLKRSVYLFSQQMVLKAHQVFSPTATKTYDPKMTSGSPSQGSPQTTLNLLIKRLECPVDTDGTSSYQYTNDRWTSECRFADVFNISGMGIDYGQTVT